MKRCAFCIGKANSKEHMWPEWAKEHLPNDGEWYRPLFYQTKGKITTKGKPSKIRQNGLRNLTVRTVCRSCNNSWMSKVEERSKPIISKLMLGENHSISHADRRQLREWLFLKACVFDQSRGFNWVISKTDRVSFMNTLRIPNDFQCWIAHCGISPFDLALNKYAASIPRGFRQGGLSDYNLMTFTIGIGKLYCFCLVDKVPFMFSRRWNFLAPPLYSLEKHTGEIKWPTKQMPTQMAFSVMNEASVMYEGLTKEDLGNLAKRINNPNVA
jgi:hypothetical protein